MTASRRTRLALSAALIAALGLPAGAHATFPGKPARIAFESYRDGNYEIYTADPDGKSPKRITTSAGNDYQPAFSADGAKLAFVSLRDGDAEIYVADVDGGNQTRVTNRPGADESPSFTPDGKTLVFSANSGGTSRIASINVDGTGFKYLTSGGSATDPAVSPDGTRIAFTRRNPAQTYQEEFSAIEVISLAGAYQYQLLGPYFCDEYWCDYSNSSEPAWSPDGEHIAYVNDWSGSPDVLRHDLLFGSYVNITPGSAAQDTNPAYTPDGQRILFRSTRVSQGGIFSMTPSGGSVTNLTVPNTFEGDPAASRAVCRGQVATIAGTSANNTLTGTPGADVIAAGAGTDTITPGDGADVVCGEGGTDTVSYADHEAGVIADLTGGTGDDGGKEDGPLGLRDSIDKDVERLTGGFEDDTLVGNSAANVLSGGSGDDSLRGGAGADQLLGATGDDALFGNDGDDTLSGASSDDSLAGGEGDDALDGGTEADTLTGGAGVDTVTYAARNAGVTVTVGVGTANDGNVQDGSAGARDTVGGTVENLLGGNGDDSLTGNDLDNRLTGGLGKDSLFGLGGLDTLIANDGVVDTVIDCGADTDAPAQRDTTDPAAVSC